MIKTESLTINGKSFIRTFSNSVTFDNVAGIFCKNISSSEAIN